MPELPDIVVYIEALESRIVGREIERVRVGHPFVVKSFDPPISTAEGRTVCGLRRMGKRIVMELDGDLFVVVHLMVAGRLKWRPSGARLPAPRRGGLAAFDFANGSLLLTEAGTKRRASILLVSGEGALLELDAGGLDVFAAGEREFWEAVTRERHTLKRVLTDPGVVDGVGGAYADEILHAARLSPIKMSDTLTEEEVARLLEAARETLSLWTARLRDEVADGFPDKVTAFREGMAVHGRYRQPCLVCGSPVQRIRYVENETNYCATCQTGGQVYADRALSRLLREDWPRSIEAWEALTDRRSERADPPAG